MRASRTSGLPNRRLSATDLPRNARAPQSLSEPPPPPAKGGKQKKKKAKPRRKSSGRMKAWLGRLSLLTGLIVVVSASIAVAWGLRRYLRTSPRFSVREIRVEGNQRRTPNQIAKQAGLDTGLNIFTVEEEAAKAAIEADPWIETAEVKVELPNAVTITVTEREARAVSVVDGQLFLTDTQGNIFKDIGEADPRDLPVVTGIDSEAIGRDRAAVTAHIRRALELVSDLEEANIAKRYPVQELHLESDGAVTVTVGTDAVVLVFGKPPFRGKVGKAERILEELRYRKVKRAVLFLDNEAHPERVVVRLETMAKND